MKDDISEKLDKILWGGRFACAENGIGNEVIVVVKDLELRDRIWIDFIYEQAIAAGKQKELMPQRELAIFLDNNGVWKKDDELSIKNLKNSLDKINEALVLEMTNREERTSLKLKASIEKDLKNKENLKASLFSSTLETYAEQQKLSAFIFCSIYKDENTRYWKTWDDFLNEVDAILIANLAELVFKKNHITVKEVRSIARSTEWRFKWCAYKNAGGLFRNPIVELTQDQHSLMYWSQVYDMAYESLDRPTQEVINDDELLDKWFEDQSTKQKQDSAQRTGNVGGVKLSGRIRNHGEIGIVTGPIAENDAIRAQNLGTMKDSGKLLSKEEIYDLNGPLEKKFLSSQRGKLIRRGGVLEEREMRSDSNSRRVINSTDAVFKKARRPDGFTGKRIVDRKQGGTLADGFKGRNK